MAILNTSNRAGASGQGSGGGGGGGFYSHQIEHSCFFDGTSSKLSKTFGTAASTDDKVAISFWLKRNGASNTNSAIGSTTNTKIISGDAFNQLEINTNNPSGFSDQFGYFMNGGGNGAWYKGKLRDPAGWYNIIWIYDSTQSTANDRVKIYINGQSLPTNDSDLWNYTNSGINPYPPQNTDTTIKKNGLLTLIGAYEYDGAGYFGGSLAEFVVIDGTASYTDFGESKNGVWVPKDPSGLTFGNNGFYLKFQDASALGDDSSGNNNDFATTGLTSANQLIDSPTIGTGS
tara:strand:- start:839 stop:1702 length:864 start_codon:yes stop_codon:yes gene_type:complete